MMIRHQTVWCVMLDEIGLWQDEMQDVETAEALLDSYHQDAALLRYYGPWSMDQESEEEEPWW